MAMTEIPAAVPAPPGCKVNYEKVEKAEKIVKVEHKSWFAWFPFLSLFEL